jgi:hypothetical protein
MMAAAKLSLSLIKVENKVSKRIEAPRVGCGGCSGCVTWPFYLLGAGLAAWTSFTLNSSTFWAIIHGLFSWWYILYLFLGFGGGIPAGI